MSVRNLRYSLLWLLTSYFVSVSALADDVPNLSGLWRPEMLGTADNLSPIDVEWYLSINQDESCVVVSKFLTLTGTQEVYRYRLDGSENFADNVVPNGERWQEISHAEWMEGKLVIEATITREYRASWDARITYSLDSEGQLRIMRTEPSLGGGKLVTETQIWVRQ